MHMEEMRTTRDQRSRMREFILYVPRSLPSQVLYVPTDEGLGEGLTVTRAYVSARIDKLRRRMREVVVRCLEQGEPDTAVAEALGISLRTLWRDMAEALDELATQD
jgi:DNA-directed RNA polymerase specialized sigma24 family protein